MFLFIQPPQLAEPVVVCGFSSPLPELIASRSNKIPVYLQIKF